jgi:hypothetical protein
MAIAGFWEKIGAVPCTTADRIPAGVFLPWLGPGWGFVRTEKLERLDYVSMVPESGPRAVDLS